MSASAAPYTLIILAGGQGRRMGGCDKGLLTVGEQTFVGALAQRLRCTVPGAAQVMVSANRNHGAYCKLGVQVCTDLRSDFQGPLAGLEAALAQVSYLQPAVIVPCDMPLLPRSLPDKLLRPVLTDPRSVAVLHDGSRRQHLCLALWPQHVLPSIRKQLDGEQYSVSEWLAQQFISEVSYREHSIGMQRSVINVNQPEDLLPLVSYGVKRF